MVLKSTNFLQIYCLPVNQYFFKKTTFPYNKIRDSLVLFIFPVIVQGRCSVLMARSFHLVAAHPLGLAVICVKIEEGTDSGGGMSAA